MNKFQLSHVLHSTDYPWAYSLFEAILRHKKMAPFHLNRLSGCTFMRWSSMREKHHLITSKSRMIEKFWPATSRLHESITDRHTIDPTLDNPGNQSPFQTSICLPVTMDSEIHTDPEAHNIEVKEDAREESTSSLVLENLEHDENSRVEQSFTSQSVGQQDSGMKFAV